MSSRYASFEMRKLHGAVHWLMLASRQGRNHRQRSSPSSMSRVQVRNLKIRCSTAIVPRSFLAEVNGPYSFTPFVSGLRVNSTRGKSSLVTICR